MSDMQDTQVVDEQIDAPDAAADETPQAPPEPQPEWASRFPNGADDMWKSYREAEAAKTRAEQEAADLRRQQAEWTQQEDQYYDPFSQLPPTVDEYEQQRIAAWAQQNPAAAAQWAYQNHERLGPEVAGQLFQYWQSRDFWAAENWKAQIINQQYYAQMRQEIQQEYEPVRQHTTAQMSQLTLSLAQQLIPDWDAWAPRIVEFLQAPENAPWRQAIDVAGLGSEAAADRLYEIYAVLHARDQRGRAATTQPAPPPAPSSQTETTSTGPARDDQGRFTSGGSSTDTNNPGRRTGRLSHL